MKQKVMVLAIAVALVGMAGYAAVTSADVQGARSRPVGIPDSNPVHEPEDGDGTCEKHETVVKTTPSGRQVTVPCHAADHGNNH